MAFSVVPGARGQINLPCNSEEDCKAIECQGGTAHCNLNIGQCQCSDFQTKLTSCSNGFGCNN
ncbi:hypothetical protein REPUB_Repub04eG0232300 [Reevesia pubescens]